MIASVAFQNFKALRNAHLDLRPFNLVIGPNGSGKTSLIQALLRLRTLSRMGPATASEVAQRSRPAGPEIAFRFDPPYEKIQARLVCDSDVRCDLIELTPPDDPGWLRLQDRLGDIRAYRFDHYAMAEAASGAPTMELASNGANLSGVLATFQTREPAAFSGLEAEIVRVMPEFTRIEFRRPTPDRVELALRLRDEDKAVTPDNLSQGTLYVLGMLALVFHPAPPAVVCIEEIDRGVHPRMLREVRDVLYRLSYPEAFGLTRPVVQVVATTHSPYLLDLFRDHPEEVVISHKQGNAAHFERLADRKDLAELLDGGSLGDIWFSGILGGVPEE